MLISLVTQHGRARNASTTPTTQALGHVHRSLRRMGSPLPHALWLRLVRTASRYHANVSSWAPWGRMTQHLYALQPLNDCAQKNYGGKTYTTLADARRAFSWYRAHYPFARFAVYRCTVTTDEHGNACINLFGSRL